MMNARYYAGVVIFAAVFISCSTLSHNPENGVSVDLAEHRSDIIHQAEYDLYFSIPKEKTDPIIANENIHFKYTSGKHTLIIDFRESADKIKKITVNGDSAEYIVQQEHIIIPSKYFKSGKNNVEINFIAGDHSLNRNEDFLYTLFVPDRARTAFPCFDQPDIKARFNLTLEVPAEWEAVANGKVKDIEKKGVRKVVKFDTTEPISTYLFAFVCGRFSKITRQTKNMPITLYYREEDPLVKRNADEIYQIVFRSISEMEKYTGIKYPFTKYDMVAIPSLQFSGMEHVGAILFRSSNIFLEQSATQEELISRANLIAHETAHMWFGDLVTMKWFNDVWVKEVFANFMADKITNPLFPNIDYRLRFLLAHFPPAYSVDRSRGANPIGQNLDNMKDAGSLYGPIIYHKAPIVMRHLENMIGWTHMRDALRKYLSEYAYSNATWDDLIKIIDKKTDLKLEDWSRQWIYEPGMPKIEIQKKNQGRSKGFGFSLSQSDPWGYDRLWRQRLYFIFGNDQESKMLPYNFIDQAADIKINQPGLTSDYILGNGLGLSYGYFSLDKQTLEYLLKNISFFKEDLTRGVAWLDLHENMLNGKVSPFDFMNSLIRAISIEKNKLILNLVNDYLLESYWHFLSNEERYDFSNQIEELLWQKMLEANDPGVKRNLFNTWKKIVLSPSGEQKMFELWGKAFTIPNLPLSENDYMLLSFELAVREVGNPREILATQYHAIENPDRKKEMRFIIPALSDDQLTRDAFFESLRENRNREKEQWVITALTYLHHPLRSESSKKYIIPSLEMLEEIQYTGDIFFPKNWLDATFSGYSSYNVVSWAERFLMSKTNYSLMLKNKILQSIDIVKRAAEAKQHFR
ncbi:MAG: M1 family aminopeptidase [Bacteroidota bacterium]|nr:M1 family aminopeptidase [Bacteroidota bacterium]